MRANLVKYQLRLAEKRQYAAIKEKRWQMKKYVCKICGWVYDPAEHDNVAFEALPDDWTCPVCGVGKEHFEEA